MSDSKLPKYRILQKAKEFVEGKSSPESKKLEALMRAIANDEAYWLWVNDALFDNFVWASEAMASKLNQSEVVALRRHIEKGDMYLARFDDPKAYQAIISEAMSLELISIKKTLLGLLRKIEEATACVLKFTKDGPIASGYPHGIPFVCYFTANGTFFVVYIESSGSNKVFSSSGSIPLHQDHIIKRVALAVEASKEDFIKAKELNGQLSAYEERLANLQKFGMTRLQ